MKKSGFTIVELIVVITIMGILLVLSVVNLRGSQVSARDVERKTDLETIAKNLENFYSYGTDGSTTVGRYPSTVLNSSNGNIKLLLRDIDTKSLTAPGLDSTNPAISFIAATNNIQSTTGVLPQPTINTYVYQPIQTDGSLCTLESQECRKFNLYAQMETDNSIYTITSKNQ